MAATAILATAIVVQFLRCGWEDYHQIRYAGAELHPKSFSQKQDSGGRHLGFLKNSHNFAVFGVRRSVAVKMCINCSFLH